MEEVSCRLVEDLSVCILGVGAIGLKVAEVLKSLGMTVYGMVSSIPKDKAVFVDQYFTMVQLPEFLKKSDYICNILPQTQETNSILDDGMLENCSANRSIFVNIGRGNVVQNDSIIEALDKGWIGGAVLDVFGEEPLPAESRLWSMPNVFITPHISGYKPELVSLIMIKRRTIRNNLDYVALVVEKSIFYVNSMFPMCGILSIISQRVDTDSLALFLDFISKQSRGQGLTGLIICTLVCSFRQILIVLHVGDGKGSV